MPWLPGGSLTQNMLLAQFAEPVLRYRTRLALHVVSGVSPTFTTRYVGDLPFLGNPVLSMDGRAFVERTLQIQTPLAQLNAAATDALQHLQYTSRTEARLPGDPKSLGDALTAGAYVNVWVGANIPDTGSSGFTNVEAQIAQLSVRRVTGSDGDVATLDLADWTAVIEENPLITTYAPVDGSGNPITVGAAVAELVQGAFPAGWIGTVIPSFTYANATVTKAGLSFNGNRSDAIAQLMDSAVPSRLSASRTGSLFAEFDPLRWTGSGTSAVWQAGVAPLAPSPIFSYETELAEDAGYNAIPLTWESADGESFGTVFLVDSTPSSPTFWNGPYGHRPAPIESIDTANTEAEAIAVATERLNASKARARKATVRINPSPIEPQDTLRLTTPFALNPAQTVTESIVCETVDFPLVPAPASITGYIRSRVVA